MPDETMRPDELTAKSGWRVDSTDEDGQLSIVVDCYVGQELLDDKHTVVYGPVPSDDYVTSGRANCAELFWMTVTQLLNAGFELQEMHEWLDILHGKGAALVWPNLAPIAVGLNYCSFYCLNSIGSERKFMHWELGSCASYCNEKLLKELVMKPACSVLIGGTPIAELTDDDDDSAGISFAVDEEEESEYEDADDDDDEDDDEEEEDDDDNYEDEEDGDEDDDEYEDEDEEEEEDD